MTIVLSIAGAAALIVIHLHPATGAGPGQREMSPRYRTSSAMSPSLRLLFWLVRRSRLNAWSWVSRCRPITMPMAAPMHRLSVDGLGQGACVVTMLAVGQGQPAVCAEQPHRADDVGSEGIVAGGVQVEGGDGLLVGDGQAAGQDAADRGLLEGGAGERPPARVRSQVGDVLHGVHPGEGTKHHPRHERSLDRRHERTHGAERTHATVRVFRGGRTHSPDAPRGIERLPAGEALCQAALVMLW